MNESKPKMKLRLNEYLYQKWTDTEFSEEEPLSEGEIQIQSLVKKNLYQKER